MSRNTMDACIDAANERDEQRETARREWLEAKAPLYTPGPWTVEEDMRPGMGWNRHIHSGPRTAVCFMAHSNEKEPARDLANARLIAAAPDLLAALRDIATFCDDPEGSERAETLALGMVRLLPAARAALAKAGAL